VLSEIEKYQKMKFGDSDELFIFFAGHGGYSRLANDGYLVTKDSRSSTEDRHYTSCISQSDLRNIIQNIPCKHILAVLDACFAGTFDPRISEGAKRGNEDEYAGISREKTIERALKYKSRLFITSGGETYVPDGRPGMHSPFARKFLEALRSLGGKDGILTFGKIKEAISRVDPEPRAGDFGSNEPGGDFIFVAK